MASPSGFMTSGPRLRLLRTIYYSSSLLLLAVMRITETSDMEQHETADSFALRTCGLLRVGEMPKSISGLGNDDGCSVNGVIFDRSQRIISVIEREDCDP